MHVWRFAIVAAAMAMLAACGNGGEPEKAGDNAAPPALSGKLGDSVIPTHYDLDLTILPERERFSGKAAIDVEVNRPMIYIWLYGRDIEVSRAWAEAGGRTIEAVYEQADETGFARLTLSEELAEGPARLHFLYEAPFNGALEGLYKVTDGAEDYAFTQFEATSARFAFPGFDEPGFKTPFDIKVTAQEDDVVITATPEVASGPAGEGLVQHTFATTPPLPTYLIAFAVGPLDVVKWEPLPPTAIRDRPVPLRGVAAKGKGGKLAYALQNTRRIVEAEEAYFGIPFPYPKLDLIAVPDFAAGAMENVGAITFREQLLLLDETASVEQKRAYVSVNAHELAHQWFGDLVTPKWWDDIWLNESFATWMGNKTASAAFPGMDFANRTLRRGLEVMKADELASARQIRQPIESAHDIATAFDGITYRKGAAVLAMFESWLGEDAFREGVRLHLRRFAHGVADVDDFLRSLADGSGRPDMVEAFRSFLFQPGVPVVTANLASIAESPAVKLSQQRYLPLGSTADQERTWRVPVCMAFGHGSGRERFCTLLDKAEEVVPLPAKSRPAWLMPNENGSGYYRFALDEAGWSALFGNFEALTGREAQALLDSLSAAYKSGGASIETLVSAFRVLARAPEREVATMPLDDLETMYRHLAESEAAKTGIESFVRGLYGTRAAELGLESRPGEDADAALLRKALVEALVELGRDEPLRRTLTEKAIAYLDGGEAGPQAMDPGLIEVALAVAVEESDPAFARRLLDRAFASRDATFRQQALHALASARDDETAAMMRQIITSSRIRDNEAIRIALDQGKIEEQRAALWRWLQVEENLQALLARIPSSRKGAIVRVAGDFCSTERAREIEAFFAGRVEVLEGGPRELAQTIERIRLCAALKAAKGPEVTATFGAGG